jgi:hypothetical protein
MAMLLLDLQSQNLPLGNGCFLCVGSADTWFPFRTDAMGNLRFAVNIPRDQRLLGMDLYGQFAVLDPTGPLAGMATLSQGLHVLIGK